MLVVVLFIILLVHFFLDLIFFLNLSCPLPSQYDSLFFYIGFLHPHNVLVLLHGSLSNFTYTSYFLLDLIFFFFNLSPCPLPNQFDSLFFTLDSPTHKMTK